MAQVANTCCNGRIVSVLEGGYRIQGSFVSAFARSVAAHVAALKHPHRQVCGQPPPRTSSVEECHRQSRIASGSHLSLARALLPLGAMVHLLQQR